MNKQQIIQTTQKFVKQRLAKEGTGHDWWHIKRVLNNAKLIAQTEQVDMFIVTLAVVLHDVGDRKVIHQDEDDYSIAENCLMEQSVPGEIINQVLYIIKNMSFSKSLDKKRKNFSNEFYVVQDADRLDAIGAIGIARAFAFGGSRSRPLYDPTLKAQKVNTTKNYRKMESSSFHHFEEKLLKLKGLMNSKAAKAIAKERHNFMKVYLKQFLLEWNGKK